MPQDEQYTSRVHLKALDLVDITLIPKSATEHEALTLHILQEESFNPKRFEKLCVVRKEVAA